MRILLILYSAIKRACNHSMPKTSAEKKTKKPKIVRKPRRKSIGPFLCYALYHTKSEKSYTGKTNNFTRRLRQHNQQLSGGARYTKSVTSGEWRPLFHVAGFQTERAVLQFEFAMKHRKVPNRFKPGYDKQTLPTKDKSYTRGPSGRVRQLEYLLSLGKLNDEPHSPFADNGISVQCFIPFERYLALGNMTSVQFTMARDLTRGINFTFV